MHPPKTTFSDRRRAARVRAGQDALDVPTPLLAFLLSEVGPHARAAAKSALGERTYTAVLEVEYAGAKAA